MENLSVIGIGKLGLCFCLTLERAGFDVVGVDIREEYVKSVNNKTLRSDEDSVEEFLQKSKNFIATTDLDKAINHSDFLYVVVATPSLPNGKYDHSQIESLIKKLQSRGKQEKRKYFIVCCTTMPEYCKQIQQKLQPLNYEVCYNPEFIAQGTILRDQAYPDMVLIGESSKEAGDKIQDHYIKMAQNEPVFCRMSCTEAEICKISLNCFLTTKISYANMIGDICNRAGANPDVVLSAVAKDSRISPKYLGYGFGYGGPCFPRDNRALAKYAISKGIDALVSKASDEMNRSHLINQFDEFVSKNPDPQKADQIRFKVVTYKPQSTMLIESQQLMFAEMLAKAGYDVLINERASVNKELKSRFGDLFKYQDRGDKDGK